MKVDYEKLALSSQVLRRQDEAHCTKAASYIQEYAILTPKDTGFVLMPFTGASLAVAYLGVQVADLYGKTFSFAADQVDNASTTYSEHERAAYEEFAAIMAQIGVPMPGYTDPRSATPTLGGADSAAPADHGAPDPGLDAKLDGAADDFVDGIKDLYDNAAARIGSWSGPGSVSERSDASSYMVAPNATRSEIENMRWGAGPILGGVDWLIEKFAGFSLLEDVIMKPFAGDWKGIEEVQQAWEHVGESMRAISDNGAGLAESGSFWEGDAGTAYQGGMVALSAAGFGLGAVADYLAGIVGNLALASNAMAATIGFALNKLSAKLLRMAAEAAIPVAGWLVAGVEAAEAVHSAFTTTRLIYTIINTIYDLIESVLEAKASLMENLMRLEDLVQVLAQTGRKYA